MSRGTDKNEPRATETEIVVVKVEKRGWRVVFVCVMEIAKFGASKRVFARL